MEVGACHNGFCDPLVRDTKKACCSMGDSGLAHEVGTFSSHVDYHTRGVLPVVYLRDYSATRNSSIYSVG